MTRNMCSILILIAFFAVPLFAQDAMHPACTNRSGQGIYGYNCSGVAVNPFDNYNVEPFAAYGVVTGDGKGQWHGYGKVSFNGSVHKWTHDTRKDQGSQVNPDCTGSVTYQVTVDGNNVPDAHFEFVIVDNGNEIKGFPVDDGYGTSCQLIREHQER